MEAPPGDSGVAPEVNKNWVEAVTAMAEPGTGQVSCHEHRDQTQTAVKRGASERPRKDDAAQFLKQRNPAGMHATIRGRDFQNLLRVDMSPFAVQEKLQIAVLPESDIFSRHRPTVLAPAARVACHGVDEIGVPVMGDSRRGAKANDGARTDKRFNSPQ